MFLKKNLPRGHHRAAIYQFLSAGIDYYCPDQRPVVDSLAGVQPQVPPAPVAARTACPPSSRSDAHRSTVRP